MKANGEKNGGPRSGGIETPCGIEVLVKKAAVDEAFRRELLARRGEAAAAIGLSLDPAERTMLSLVPAEQLARIIAQTEVPAEQRRVFLGSVAAAMLAVIGVGLAGCEQNSSTSGTGPAPSSRPSIPGAVPVAGFAAIPVPSTQTQPATTTTSAPATTRTFYGAGGGGGAGPARN